MLIENGKIILGHKNCYCEDGTQSTRIPCGECKGTGNGKRGGRGGCRKCNGSRNDYDHINRSTCSRCKGNPTNFERETLCDYLPDGVWESLTFKVIRNNAPMSIAESLIGIGCVFSCTDYGTAWKRNNDDELIASVKESKSHQATNIATDDGTICDFIGIFVNQMGYTVKAVFVKK